MAHPPYVLAVKDDVHVFKVPGSRFWVLSSGFGPAAGLKSGQSNLKRNSEKANIE
jgi:hypothetical protein